MSVDLPAPFSPTRAWISPVRTSRDAPRFARTGPNDLWMSLNLIASGWLMNHSQLAGYPEVVGANRPTRPPSASGARNMGGRAARSRTSSGRRRPDLSVDDLLAKRFHPRTHAVWNERAVVSVIHVADPVLRETQLIHAAAEAVLLH